MKVRFDLAGKAHAAWRGLKRRSLGISGKALSLGRGKAGIAAVEFALILPMMLVLYIGCAVLAQGLDAGRKTQLLSKTLADLTAQITAGTYSDGNCSGVATPCVTDSDLVTQIFNSSSAVLYPFTGATTMTISEVIFDNIAGTTNCCEAKLVWSAASGAGATARACGTFSSSGSGKTYIPAGLYPTAVANNGGPDTYLIVADVTFVFTPAFGLAAFSWGQNGSGGSGYSITMTTYMTPRGSATTPISWTPSGTIASSGQYSSCPIWTTSANPPAGDYNYP